MGREEWGKHAVYGSTLRTTTPTENGINTSLPGHSVNEHAMMVLASYLEFDTEMYRRKVFQTLNAVVAMMCSTNP